MENNQYYKFADSLIENLKATELSEIIRQDMRRYSRNLTERNDRE